VVQIMRTFCISLPFQTHCGQVESGGDREAVLQVGDELTEEVAKSPSEREELGKLKYKGERVIQYIAGCISKLVVVPYLEWFQTSKTFGVIVADRPQAK
jgi:hypothetical protein